MRMLSEFEKKVANFISSHDCLRGGEKVLVAVSGGADSMALLHVLSRLRSAGVFNAEVSAAHVNHQLRGVDSDGDESFVARK